MSGPGCSAGAGYRASPSEPAPPTPACGRAGGYLVGPGSVVGGRAYAIEADLPVAPLPGWLAELLAAPVSLRAGGGAARA
jgi:hypothetical protein